jgi:hypothetical protein
MSTALVELVCRLWPIEQNVAGAVTISKMFISGVMECMHGQSGVEARNQFRRRGEPRVGAPVGPNPPCLSAE